MFRQAKIITLEIGHLIQVQDDYLDCFGDTEILGKDGTDIQDGKCAWPIVVALQRATPEQRKILEVNIILWTSFRRCYINTLLY
jgi:farnesyl diphosphate synthase